MAICDPCRAAGAANKRLNENYPATADAEAVARLHSSCRGGNWCDCAHVVGQSIQEEFR